jgi:hypothetical protein
MSTRRVFQSGVVLISALMLAACASSPGMTQDPAPVPAPVLVADKNVRIDETAMLPLLGYFQLLLRLTPQELARERTMLATIPQTPSTQLRTSMLLSLTRVPADLVRAQSLLDGLLKSTDPAAVSLFPLARLLSSQYNERQKSMMQNEKLTAQGEQLGQQLKDSVRRSAELQEKLDALADIERSLPVRSPAAVPGTVR